MSFDKIILVTGSNRGIGLEVVRRLVESDLKIAIIVTSRNIDDATAVVASFDLSGKVAALYARQLDVTNDDSIKALVESVKRQWGRLDVLINNAGYATRTAEDLSNYREVWNSIYNVNVTSVGLLVESFLPLLKASSDRRVINVSSGRASFARSSTNPPTAVMAYSVSKTALNMLSVELAKSYPDILVQAVNPGHCKTNFNGFRGTKDPYDGAVGIVELALAERGKYTTGFWEHDEKEGMVVVPW